MPTCPPPRPATTIRDWLLVTAFALVFIAAQFTVFAVRAQAEESAGIDDDAPPAVCRQDTGTRLEALLLKHRPYLALTAPVTRADSKTR